MAFLIAAIRYGRYLPLALMTCLLAISAPSGAQTLPSESDVAKLHGKLTAAYNNISSVSFYYHENEVDEYGNAALKLSGDERLYRLWRVLYAYRITLDERKLKYWRQKIGEYAQKEGDADMDLLARFMWQSYENEVSGFILLSDREWNTYLTAPNKVLQNVAMVERERHLQYFYQWADAIDLGHELILRLQLDGSSAQAALMVAHQSMAYNMFRVGDAQSYADNMMVASELSKSNSFFIQKMDFLYDLTYFSAAWNDPELAQQLQHLYNGYVEHYRLKELQPLNQKLCAFVAERAGDDRGLLECLRGVPAMQGVIRNDLDVVTIKSIILAYARLGDASKAQYYLGKLNAIPSSTSGEDKLFRQRIEAYLAAVHGRNAEAFKNLDEWSRESLSAAEQRRIASIQGMYKALRKELDKKTEESRLLAERLKMQHMLLVAGGIIAVMLALLVAGSVYWVFRMRRMHRSLNEAHDHAEAANAAKSRFLAVMSHELRTPLNGVLGMAQALRKDDLNPAQREQVNILVDSGQTLMALLNDVLDMSRIEAGKIELSPSPASMRDMAERVINTYGTLVEGKDVILRYYLDDSAKQLMLFDMLRVYQCLSNLVSNAVKFTEKGSVKILISAEARRGGGYMVRCEVRDTGIGMSKTVIDKLFEAYSQADASTARKYGGSGLGLSISRRLAELMGGSLSVTSQEGQGSTFVMTFKAEEVLEEAPHAEALSPVVLAEEDEDLPGMQILLVDDHPVNRKVARLFLEPFGFVITEAADGQEALDLDMSRFDLVLMDLNMPKMGGLEATRIFRAGEAPGRHVPIVALTADAMKDQMEACYAAGMDAHLAKPIVMDVLIDTVARLLHLHGDAEEGEPAKEAV